MIAPRFTSQSGTLTTLPFLVYHELALVCTKIHKCIALTPKKRFTSFMKPAVDAREQVDENLKSSVVTQTMNFLANSVYHYLNMDRSRNTVT